MSRKLFWQSVLDEAREEVSNNPHLPSLEEHQDPDLYVTTHQQYLIKKAINGWNVGLSLTEVDGDRQWHFSGILDPVGRPFDISDMNFLVGAARYLGADLLKTKIVISNPENPVYFSWVEERSEVDNGEN
jgi:hypothetical protein